MADPETEEEDGLGGWFRDGVRAVGDRGTTVAEGLTDTARGVRDRGVDLYEEGAAEVERARASLVAWPGRAGERLEEMAGSSEAVVREAARSLMPMDIEVPELSGETLNRLIDLQSRYGTPALAALGEGDYDRLVEILVPALERAGRRGRALGRAFGRGLLTGGRETHEWFAGGEHDAALLGLGLEMRNVRWARATDDFRDGVLVGIAAPVVQVVALIDDVDELMDALLVLAAEVALHPAGEELAEALGELLGSAPEAILADLYETPGELIPYRAGEVLGAPIAALAIGFAIGMVAGPAAIAALAGKVTGRGTTLVRRSLRAGARVARRFHKDESGALKIDGPLALIARMQAGEFRKAHFIGWDLEFDNLPGRPRPRSSRKGVLPAAALDAPDDLPSWGWSDQVWGRGGIHGIRGRFAEDRMIVSIAGELLEPEARSGSRKFNSSYRPQPQRLADYFALEDMEILHLWGPGFGDEAEAGLMIGHRELNGLWQNGSIERALRALREPANAQNLRVLLMAEAKSHPVSRTHQTVPRTRPPDHVQTEVPERYPIPERVRVQYRDSRRRGGLFLEEVRYRFRIVDGDGETVGIEFEVSITSSHPDPATNAVPHFDVTATSWHDAAGSGLHTEWEALFRSVLGK